MSGFVYCLSEGVAVCVCVQRAIIYVLEKHAILVFFKLAHLFFDFHRTLVNCCLEVSIIYELKHRKCYTGMCPHWSVVAFYNHHSCNLTATRFFMQCMQLWEDWF